MLGVGGYLVRERAFVADEVIADEDIDVFTQSAGFINYVIAKTVPALIDGADGLSDGRAIDIAFAEVGEEAGQVGCEIDACHAGAPWFCMGLE